MTMEQRSLELIYQCTLRTFIQQDSPMLSDCNTRTPENSRGANSSTSFNVPTSLLKPVTSSTIRSLNVT